MIESANNSLKRGLVRRESFPDTEHLRQRVNERARTNNVCLSCSRTGNCHDNTVAESFHAEERDALPQAAVLRHQPPDTRKCHGIALRAHEARIRAAFHGRLIPQASASEKLTQVTGHELLAGRKAARAADDRSGWDAVRRRHPPEGKTWGGRLPGILWALSLARRPARFGTLKRAGRQCECHASMGVGMPAEQTTQLTAADRFTHKAIKPLLSRRRVVPDSAPAQQEERSN